MTANVGSNHKMVALQTRFLVSWLANVTGASVKNRANRVSTVPNSFSSKAVHVRKHSTDGKIDDGKFFVKYHNLTTWASVIGQQNAVTSDSDQSCYREMFGRKRRHGWVYKLK